MLLEACMSANMRGPKARVYGMALITAARLASAGCSETRKIAQFILYFLRFVDHFLGDVRQFNVSQI